MIDYIAMYGLDSNPFIKNSKDVLIETTDSKELNFRLNYLTKVKGFGVITGSPGKGKTTIVRHWSNNLNPSLFKVVYICLSTLSVIEFYRSLVTGLGCIPEFKKTDNFNLIQSEINRLVIEKHITPVIIIDEANYISNGILNDLKMIFRNCHKIN